MSGLKITRIILIVVAVGLGLWDLYAQLVLGTSATISNAIIVFAHKQPWVAFIAGFIMGHLFWRMEPTKEIIKVWEKYGKPNDKDIKE